MKKFKKKFDEMKNSKSLIVLGAAGNGKSTFLNQIAGKSEGI